MFRNKQQNSQLHALIGKLSIDKETKEELVYEFTNGRTNSSSKMLVNECQNLINKLKVMVNTPGTVSDKYNTPENKMRRKIIAICREMGWEKNGEADMNRINTFLDKYGYLKKPLNDYKYKELPELVTQFEKILESYYAKR